MEIKIKTETVSAMDLEEGNLIKFYGHICRVSNYAQHECTDPHHPHPTPYARYTLNVVEAANDFGLNLIEGGTFGGNELAKVARVIEQKEG